MSLMTTELVAVTNLYPPKIYLRSPSFAMADFVLSSKFFLFTATVLLLLRLVVYAADVAADKIMLDNIPAIS